MYNYNEKRINNMAIQTSHPKNYKRCVFCKRWTGENAANPVFKSPQTGFQFNIGVYGKCAKNGSNQPSTGGVNCRDYEPSPTANRVL